MREHPALGVIQEKQRGGRNLVVYGNKYFIKRSFGVIALMCHAFS